MKIKIVALLGCMSILLGCCSYFDYACDKIETKVQPSCSTCIASCDYCSSDYYDDDA